MDDSIYGFVMDFDDNGRLDFVIIKRSADGISALQAFYNNYSRDSYYVTASTYTNSDSSYGFKGFGVSARGVYTTLSDNKQVFVSEQLTRSSYGALQNSLASYAIGRSNNYIEDFTVAYHNQKINDKDEKYSLEVEKKSWSPIIPNSHLLIDIHEMSSSSWGIKLLINPTDSFILVGVILTLILILIGGLIIYIHLKEKKEDEQSRNPQLDFF